MGDSKSPAGRRVGSTPTDAIVRSDGGIGRRGGLKIRFPRECRFDSGSEHSNWSILWVSAKRDNLQTRDSAT